MIFGPKSVNSVVAVFTKAITDLEAIKADKQQVIANNAVKIEELDKANVEAGTESERATSIIAKLTDLVK